jgi:hypothetical protein
MRFWGRIRKEDKIAKDITVTAADFISAVAAICDGFDLSKPLILKKHDSEIRNFNRTVFYPDDFIEHVSFDFLEIEKIVIKKK